MAKKSLIKLKRGILSADHFARIGTAMWLFLYIMDHTGWEDGVYCVGYVDGDAAEEFGVSVRTVLRWRKRLEWGGYVTCSQTIEAQNWSNPKENWGQWDGGVEIFGCGVDNWNGSQIAET